MAGRNQRQVDLAFQVSGNDAESIRFNMPSGADKSLLVGPRFLPIPIAGATWTTNVTTATALPVPGVSLYVYNNSSTAYAITVGQSSAVAAQAIGAFDANGNVGIACAPNTYTYIAMGNNQWVIANNAALIVYMVEDPSKFVQQTGPLVPQNVPGYVLPINS